MNEIFKYIHKDLSRHLIHGWKNFAHGVSHVRYDGDIEYLFGMERNEPMC
jgi:hypothetical protein